MEKCISGAVLCLAAALVESAKYLSAAVYMAGNASQSRELFEGGLKYVGNAPDVMAAVALAAGMLLITWGIMDTTRRK